MIKFYSLKARHALHALHSLTLRPCLDDVRLETTRGGTGVPESTRQDFSAFLRLAFIGRILRLSFGPGPESKIWEKPDPDPESLFNFGSSRGLCDFLSKYMGKLRLD